MTSPVSRLNSPHYAWGEVCDGWRLVDNPAMSVIEERVPPGRVERRHYHKAARQFFYILEGEACIEVEGTEQVITRGQGLEVSPGQSHQFKNQSSSNVVFLVTSSPNSKDDRFDT